MRTKKQPNKVNKSRADSSREIREKSSKAKPAKETALAVAPELKKAAEKIIPQVIEGVTKFSSALADAVQLDAQIQDVRERELWRYCETPYKSWTAFVHELKMISGKSAATLFGVVGLQKALPGTTAEQRRKIGPRKGAKVAKAAKIAKKKGQVLPPEIIETAEKGTQSELEQKIREADLEEKPKAKAPDIQDDLLCETEKNTLPYNPRNGGSKVVEGNIGDAAQFDSVVRDAIECASKIYCLHGEKPETDISANLRFICNLWLGSECEAAGHEKQTNAEALAEWRKKHHNHKSA